MDDKRMELIAALEKRLSDARNTLNSISNEDKTEVENRIAEIEGHIESVKQGIEESQKFENDSRQKIDDLQNERKDIIQERMKKEEELAPFQEKKDKYDNTLKSLDEQEKARVSQRKEYIEDIDAVIRDEEEKKLIGSMTGNKSPEYMEELEKNDRLLAEHRERRGIMLNNFDVVMPQNMQLMRELAEQNYKKSDRENFAALRETIGNLNLQAIDKNKEINNLNSQIKSSMENSEQDIKTLNLMVSEIERTVDAEYTRTANQNAYEQTYENNNNDWLPKAQEANNVKLTKEEISEMAQTDYNIMNEFRSTKDLLNSSIDNFNKGNKDSAAYTAQIVQDKIKSARDSLTAAERDYDSKHARDMQEKKRLESELQQLKDKEKAIDKDLNDLTAKRDKGMKEINNIVSKHDKLSKTAIDKMGFFAKRKFEREQKQQRDLAQEHAELKGKIDAGSNAKKANEDAIKRKEEEIRKIEREMAVDTVKLEAKKQAVDKAISPMEQKMNKINENSVKKVNRADLERKAGRTPSRQQNNKTAAIKPKEKSAVLNREVV